MSHIHYIYHYDVPHSVSRDVMNKFRESHWLTGFGARTIGLEYVSMDVYILMRIITAAEIDIDMSSCTKQRGLQILSSPRLDPTTLS